LDIAFLEATNPDSNVVAFWMATDWWIAWLNSPASTTVLMQLLSLLLLFSTVSHNQAVFY
jgi:ABC-type transport system involved in cytochrome bd biosynthesis fused ATPase/permease subunit